MDSYKQALSVNFELENVAVLHEILRCITAKWKFKNNYLINNIWLKQVIKNKSSIIFQAIREKISSCLVENYFLIIKTKFCRKKLSVFPVTCIESSFIREKYQQQSINNIDYRLPTVKIWTGSHLSSNFFHGKTVNKGGNYLK